MYRPEDILINYNVPYNLKLKVCNYIDHLILGNPLNNLETFGRYISFYFPNNMIKTKSSQFAVGFSHSNTDPCYYGDIVEVTLEDFYRLQKGDEIVADFICDKMKYLCGVDNEEKFIRYIKDFNNWNSDDWLLFVAEKG